VRNDSWCAAVGPVVFESSSASLRLDDRVAILTWNTHVGAGDINALVTGLRRGDFTGDRPVRHFVLLLQEVVRSGPVVPRLMPPGSVAGRFIAAPGGRAFDVSAMAHELRADILYAPAMRNGDGLEDRGNAIVSTLPIESIELVELPLLHQRRVAIVATLGPTSIAAAPRVRVVSVHLDTGIAVAHGGPARWRRRQTRALLDAMTPSPAPTVVGGDFNTWWGDDEPAVRDLRAEFPDTVARAASAPTWRGPLGTGGRLDHLFVRGFGSRVEVQRIGERYGSDHYPLIALVRVPEGSDRR
jgi:endonuclease/exonuclease/phosphatase family metal-dependent hydrolase